MKKLVLVLGVLISLLNPLHAEKTSEPKLDNCFRIKKLIPDHPLVPAMHIALPRNYVCTSASDLNVGRIEGCFWAPEGVMENAVKSMGKGENGQERFYVSPSAPAIHVDISSNVLQTGRDTFNIEASQESSNRRMEKLRWGDHPVLFMITKKGNVDLYSAYVGLNSNSKVLSITLLPPEDASKSKKAVEDLNLFWTQFLGQSGPANSFLYPTNKQDLPSEFAVLKLPKGTGKNWNTINRAITSEDSIVESIPANQRTEDWTELLAAQYIGGVLTDRPGCLNVIMETIEKTTLSAYPGGKVDWAILEKGEHGFICEKVLHEPYRDILPEYEVARFILFNNGIHRISYTKRKEKITLEEKQAWLSRLKHHMFIKPKNEAYETLDGFSLSN